MTFKKMCSIVGLSLTALSGLGGIVAYAHNTFASKDVVGQINSRLAVIEAFIVKSCKGDK